MGEKLRLSEPTIQLFERLLGLVQIKADAPDFEATASAIITAKRELSEARVALYEKRDPSQS